MRVIGLTGGIASGKSTVARALEELGARVIDADRLAREVVEPGEPAYREIVETFGREILNPDQTIDRKKLGAIVFADPARRLALNAITHPRISAATQARLAALREIGVEVAIYEAALLVENKVHLWLDGLIVVAADEATQIARAVKRDGLTEEEARARVRAQAPLGDKLAVATWVVDTTGPIEETRRRVAELWDEIRRGSR